jgi:hypothetical protein
MPISKRPALYGTSFSKWDGLCMLSEYISWGSIIAINKEVFCAEEDLWRVHTSDSTVVCQLHWTLLIPLCSLVSAQPLLR